MSSSSLSVHPSFLLHLLKALSMHHLAVLFLLWNMPLLPSSTTLFFFLPYILGIRSLSFSILTLFLQLHLFFYTLHTVPLSFLLFLLLFLSSSMLFGISCTIYSLLVFQGRILVLDFYRSVPPYLCILHNPHMLLPSPVVPFVA